MNTVYLNQCANEVIKDGLTGPVTREEAEQIEILLIHCGVKCTIEPNPGHADQFIVVKAVQGE